MKKYTCILVDDEPLARELIAGFIAECPELELLAQLSNAIETRAFLQLHIVDLMFLDINMPRLSGIKLVKSLAQVPAVIFITAYAEYAVEGFDLEAVDYLLKPVSEERFFKAVGRFLDKAAQQVPQMDYILVKADKKIYRIDLDDLLYAKALGDYIRVVTKEKTLTVYERLSTFTEKLPSNRFCRIHKSHLIALSKIDYVEGNRIKIGKIFLPVSNTYRNELNERLKT
jgi:DNA-binding LytR/AlgR family response regulator